MSILSTDMALAKLEEAYLALVTVLVGKGVITFEEVEQMIAELHKQIEAEIDKIEMENPDA